MPGVSRRWFSHTLISGAHILFCSALFLLLSGCALMRGDLERYDRQLRNGSFEEATRFADVRAGKKNRNQLLWSLQAGLAARHSQDYQASNTFFDQAEELIKKYDLKNAGSSVTESLSSMLINDSARDYQPSEYEGIMVNTYKAFNYLALDRPDQARVEFNRALDRQRRAKERFQNAIAKQRQAIALRQRQENQRSGQQGFDLERSLDRDHLSELTRNRYSNFSEFGVYPNFINPFTTYSAGLFFALSGDYSKASSFLKEAAAMVPENELLLADLAMVEEALDRGQPIAGGVWVIVENGRAAQRREIRLDVPLFLVSQRLVYTGIALPMLVRGEEAVHNIGLRADGKLSTTLPLASMDKVMQTEFKDIYWSIVTRAMLSAMMKTTLQYQAEKELGLAGLIVTGVFQVATTAADLRSWTGLPASFQLGRLAMPADQRLTLLVPGHRGQEIQLPPCQSAIIYITIPDKDVSPVTRVFVFNPFS